LKPGGEAKKMPAGSGNVFYEGVAGSFGLLRGRYLIYLLPRQKALKNAPRFPRFHSFKRKKRLVIAMTSLNRRFLRFFKRSRNFPEEAMHGF